MCPCVCLSACLCVCATLYFHLSIIYYCRLPLPYAIIIICVPVCQVCSILIEIYYTHVCVYVCYLVLCEWHDAKSRPGIPNNTPLARQCVADSDHLHRTFDHQHAVPDDKVQMSALRAAVCLSRVCCVYNRGVLKLGTTHSITPLGPLACTITSRSTAAAVVLFLEHHRINYRSSLSLCFALFCFVFSIHPLAHS